MVIKIDTTVAQCKGRILLKDAQPLFTLLADVWYPSGKASFIYTYKEIPERWRVNVGVGLSNNWKPFLLADYGKVFGFGMEVASDRWGLYLRRRF
jgi:hypothetical protein